MCKFSFEAMTRGAPLKSLPGGKFFQSLIDLNLLNSQEFFFSISSQSESPPDEANSITFFRKIFIERVFIVELSSKRASGRKTKY